MDSFDDELPELPIPRPGESRAREEQPAPIAPPTLGGGASYTSASEDDAPLEPLRSDTSLSDVERERLAAERLSWELAAQLTSGMLANPARGHASVKDAMGLFDQFLQEMHAYNRIASSIEHERDSGERRRAHEAYFHGAREAEESTPDASDSTRIIGPVNQPKPIPAKPRPMGTYQAIPPGVRSVPYAPGSMAGGPPPPAEAPDADVA